MDKRCQLTNGTDFQSTREIVSSLQAIYRRKKLRLEDYRLAGAGIGRRILVFICYFYCLFLFGWGNKMTMHNISVHYFAILVSF